MMPIALASKRGGGCIALLPHPRGQRPPLDGAWPTLEGTWRDPDKADGPVFEFKDRLVTLTRDGKSATYGVHVSDLLGKSRSARNLLLYDPKTLYDRDFGYDAALQIRFGKDGWHVLYTDKGSAVQALMAEDPDAPPGPTPPDCSRFKLTRKK